jgi:6-phosphofructokinase
MRMRVLTQALDDLLFGDTKEQNGNLHRSRFLNALSKESHMATKRIGILTGGGDVPGLNSVIKSVVYRGAELGCEVDWYPPGLGRIDPRRSE